MLYRIVKQIERIKDFDIKIEQAKTINWKIKNMINSCGGFQKLEKGQQQMIIDYIKKF